jgi:hypothetical protein
MVKSKGKGYVEEEEEEEKKEKRKANKRVERICFGFWSELENSSDGVCGVVFSDGEQTHSKTGWQLTCLPMEHTKKEQRGNWRKGPLARCLGVGESLE